jgi:hypothetical protein
LVIVYWLGEEGETALRTNGGKAGTKERGREGRFSDFALSFVDCFLRGEVASRGNGGVMGGRKGRKDERKREGRRKVGNERK